MRFASYACDGTGLMDQAATCSDPNGSLGPPAISAAMTAKTLFGWHCQS